jgi:hypothetical protein
MQECSICDKFIRVGHFITIGWTNGIKEVNDICFCLFNLIYLFQEVHPSCSFMNKKFDEYVIDEKFGSQAISFQMSNENLQICVIRNGIS